MYRYLSRPIRILPLFSNFLMILGSVSLSYGETNLGPQLIQIGPHDCMLKSNKIFIFIFQDANILDAGAISGICFAVIGLFCGISFAVVAMYRRRYLNTPQTLSEPDSSGYIDDSTIRVILTKENQKN